jgi:hypothetical protein
MVASDLGGTGFSRPVIGKIAYLEPGAPGAA